MKSHDIGSLVELGQKFGAKLRTIKKAQPSQGFEWYPYDTFSGLPVLARMLRAERRGLVDLAGIAPVLDIGCGDGDLSFFLESVGCRVQAIDNPHTNHNGMLGFNTLKRALSSAVTLQHQDIDNGLDLKGRTFGLAISLGVLYHLKNPFGVLENLAHYARYCILSTRIAQVTVHGTNIARDPIAYLLDRAETNNDPTNYWIFSETGLRRLFDRTGWDLCDYSTTGVQRDSDPARYDRDQRAFCMLRSKLPDPWNEFELEGGWHDMEDGTWRWTERTFAARLRPSGSCRMLRFHFVIPTVSIDALGSIRMRAVIGETCLQSCEYKEPGQHTYIQEVTPNDLTAESILIRFELDNAYGPTETDRRQLGVQVNFWSSTEGEPRQLCPIRIS